MLREPELYVAADMAIREELRQINVVENKILSKSSEVQKRLGILVGHL